jgi:hypothetical protein
LDEGSASYQQPDAGDASGHPDPVVLASLENPSAGKSNGEMVEIYEEETSQREAYEDETNESKCLSLNFSLVICSHIRGQKVP